MTVFKNSLRLGAGGVLLAGAALVPGVACAPPAHCGNVSFAPNSDWVAVKLAASKTACTTARALASTGKHGPATFSAYAFNCSGLRITSSGAPYISYVCSGPSGRAVTWRLYP